MQCVPLENPAAKTQGEVLDLCLNRCGHVCGRAGRTWHSPTACFPPARGLAARRAAKPAQRLFGSLPCQTRLSRRRGSPKSRSGEPFRMLAASACRDRAVEGIIEFEHARPRSVPGPAVGQPFGNAQTGGSHTEQCSEPVEAVPAQKPPQTICRRVKADSRSWHRQSTANCRAQGQPTACASSPSINPTAVAWQA